MSVVDFISNTVLIVLRDRLYYLIKPLNTKVSQ